VLVGNCLFREIATPKKTYQDKRVYNMIALVQKLAIDLSTTHEDKWNYLVKNVIKVYQAKKDMEKKDEEKEDD